MHCNSRVFPFFLVFDISQRSVLVHWFIEWIADRAGSADQRENVSNQRTMNEAGPLESDRFVERVKRSCVSLIIKTGKLLKIDHTAVITALSFLHRFYGEYSVFKNDRFLVSMACVYLGGKVADCPKSSRDVLVSGFSVLNPNKKPDKSWLEGARKKLVKAERVLLYQTGFKFSIKTANEHMMDILLKDERLGAFLKGTLGMGDQELAKFNRLSNTLVNSSAKIPLVVQHDPKAIAAACVWFVIKLLKLPDTDLNQPRPWYAAYTTAEELKEVSEQLSSALVRESIEAGELTST